MASLRIFLSLFGFLFVSSNVHAIMYYGCHYAGEFIPDTEDCGAYYVCDGDNKGQYFHCDFELEYSVYTSNCVEDGDCDAGIRPPISTTERPEYTGTAPPNVHCGLPGQTYPDPYYCNLFWYCPPDLNPIPTSCGDLYYNVYTGTCDYPYNVACSGGVRPPTTTGHPTTHTTASSFGTIHTPPPSVHCSYTNELIPDPYNCAVYWNCFDGVYPIYQECPDHLLFNVYCGCCDFPDNVECYNGVRPSTTQSPGTGTPTIPPWVFCGYPGEHIPDRYDCQVYYVCTEDTSTHNLYPVYYKCTTDLEFNTITNTCDYPENVECTGGIRPTDGPTPPTATYPTAPPCVTCRWPGDIIPDCYDCTVFYICDANNVPQYRHCSPGLYYNEHYLNCAPTSTCSWTSPRPTSTIAPITTIPSYVLCDYVGQMVADRSNCQKYYYCFDVTPPETILHLCCAPTLQFNDVTTLCDDHAAVVCGSRPDDPFGECPSL